MRLKTGLAVLATAATGVAFTASPAFAGDKDCSDFSNWHQAQHFYKKHGGPRRDPDRLDADHDGIACEALR